MYTNEATYSYVHGVANGKRFHYAQYTVQLHSDNNDSQPTKPTNKSHVKILL